LAALQPTFYRALHDAVDLIAAQAQPLAHRLLAGRRQPVDRQSLKQRREPASRFRPGQLHHPNPILAAFCAGWLGMENGPLFARVQVPPVPLRLVVVLTARLAAL